MRTAKIFFVLAASALALCSCKSTYELLLEGNDYDAKYDAAFDYFNQGKYQKASQLFESLSIVTDGTERNDTVQFYWGLSNYRYQDFYTAETNFESFVEKFPGSPFTEEAAFLRVDCLYNSTLRYELDQTPSTKCIGAIGEFLTKYPLTDHLDVCRKMLDDLGERMDKKALESAKLYYKMEDYQASRVALKNVLKDDAENIYREEVLYYTTMSSYKYARESVPAKQKERYLLFIDDYLNYIGEYPDSEHRREVDQLYKKAQKAIGRFTGTDDDEDNSEKSDKKSAKEGK